MLVKFWRCAGRLGVKEAVALVGGVFEITRASRRVV